MFAVLMMLGMMTHAAAWEPSEESSTPVAATMRTLDLTSPALFPPTIDASLPENIDAPQAILSTMRAMWAASPTFRRQCARLARAREGRIVMSIRTQRSVEFQAVSQIERKGAVWTAHVEVHIDSKLVEMIAHEFEHLIEHIDAVDLARLAQQGLDGVISGATHFETARAMATGKRVAREYAERGKQAS